MPTAQYFQTSGPLGDLYQATGFSHAVVLPPGAQIAITAGQAGLHRQQRETASAAEQIERCFDNCDTALKAAGMKEGLWKAHKIQCYLLDVSLEPVMMEI